MNAQKVFAEPQRGHISLGKTLRILIFSIPVVILGIVLFMGLGRGTDVQKITAIVTEALSAILVGILVSGTACSFRPFSG